MRVVWTPAEIQTLANEFSRLFENKQIFNLLDGLREAQKVLPANRRRNLTNLQVISKPHQELFRSLMKAKPTPPPPPPPADPLGEAIDRLAGVLADRILAAVKFKVERALTPVIMEQIEIQRKPRVLVVGPKPDQQEILKKEFDHSLNLRFVASDEMNRVADTAKNCEHVIVWTNFVNHSQTANLRHKRLVTGGVSALKSALSEIT